LPPAHAVKRLIRGCWGTAPF